MATLTDSSSSPHWVRTLALPHSSSYRNYPQHRKSVVNHWRGLGRQVVDSVCGACVIASVT
jgi:hypothetical protein